MLLKKLTAKVISVFSKKLSKIFKIPTIFKKATPAPIPEPEDNHGPRIPEPEPIDISIDDLKHEEDEIIDNFKSLVESMTDDGYELKYSHSFSSSKTRTAGGTDGKKWSMEQIVGATGKLGGVLETAIQNKGRRSVAQAIQDNGNKLQEIAEDLIFAIYDSKYSHWGGGADEFWVRLNDLKDILESGPDYKEGEQG